jgi:hypothetical protein
MHPFATIGLLLGLTAAIDACRPQPAARPDERVGPTDPARCYPYRLRDGACLTRCSTEDDCADHARPGEPLSGGWPLDCRSGECVPLPPNEVPDR